MLGMKMWAKRSGLCYVGVSIKYVLYRVRIRCYCFFFFFSSRRRHTRYWRDWSSDVCSSDLDVNTYLKSWRVPENDFTREQKVTLRRLLSHTAGLTVHGFPGYNSASAAPTVPQILDGVKPANTPPVRVDVTPGSMFRYSGGGYTVAQLLMTDVTGLPFSEFMRHAVLA